MNCELQLIEVKNSSVYKKFNFKDKLYDISQCKMSIRPHVCIARNLTFWFV